MAALKLGRVLTLVFLLKLSVCQDEVPDVTIEVLKPKGFRASVADVPNLRLFTFEGNVNQPIRKYYPGTLSGEVRQSTNGRWMFEDTKVELKPGDIINYYVILLINEQRYFIDKLSYKVTGTEPEIKPSVVVEPLSQGVCKPTVTMVRGGRACAGDVLFEDNFNELNENAWQIEQFIPVNNPEFPFVSYQRLSDPTVFVSDGNLHIKPTLQQNQPGFNNESIYSSILNLFSG